MKEEWRADLKVRPQLGAEPGFSPAAQPSPEVGSLRRLTHELRWAGWSQFMEPKPDERDADVELASTTAA